MVPSFVRGLAAFGDDVALHADDRVTYAELDALVERAAEELAGARRLVLVHASNTVSFVVQYFGALRAGHAVVLAGDRRAASSLIEAYDPDVVIDPGAPTALRRRRDEPVAPLHPDLALVLSTSGSTGSPKAVRLSYANLDANAEAIAASLGIRPTDRAAVPLPLHYCYGLSVLHSNLLRGAAVVLTEASVVDACFWRRFREAGATSLSGVPYTFDLLDRVGFEAMDLPTLRYVTQAGGRLAPERVRQLARLGRRRGWELVVMYGQTEATARMAYLPPSLAESRPDAVGVAVPGGAFTVEPLDADAGPAGVGELVYRGPNVMLGYAHDRGDLALGRTVDRLRTGDLARIAPDGLVEIVGRKNRFVKLHGVRVDLDRVEHLLADGRAEAVCAGDDEGVVVAVTGAADVGAAERVVFDELRLPRRLVDVIHLPELPRLDSGKPDRAALLATSRTSRRTSPAATGSVAALFARALGRNDVDAGDSFVSLGGDSLSYVEVSLGLERLVGSLPDDWPSTTIADLEEIAAARRPSPRLRRVETGIVLRAGAIFAIVGSHAGLVRLRGGAHVLLAVAGYNVARFQLERIRRTGRARALATAAARLAAPTIAWIGLVASLTGGYSLANLALVHNRLGRTAWGDGWQYWYIEALVQLLLVGAAVFCIPAVRAWERRRPFPAAITAVAVGLVLRFDVLAVPGDPERRIHRPETTFWIFAVGWAAQRATTTQQRLLVSALALLGSLDFTGWVRRDLLIAAGTLVLVWVRSVPLPRPAAAAVAVVAGASLAIYLTHWQIYRPLLEVTTPAAAVVASLAGGIAISFVGGRAASAAKRLVARHDGERPDGRLEVGGDEVDDLVLSQRASTDAVPEAERAQRTRCVVEEGTCTGEIAPETGLEVGIAPGGGDAQRFEHTGARS